MIMERRNYCWLNAVFPFLTVLSNDSPTLKFRESHLDAVFGAQSSF